LELMFYSFGIFPCCTLSQLELIISIQFSMTIEQEKVIEALAAVRDPKSGQSIVKMKMIDDVRIYDQFINLTLALPAMEMQDKQSVNFACMEAVQKVYPEANVNVHIVTRTAQSQQANSALPHIKNIIAVASGKGGVGKSTVAVNLALGLKSLGARVGLIDADLYGPSIPTMLGLVGQRPKVQEVTGQMKLIPLQAFGMPVMSIGFIVEPEQAVVLRGPRLAAVLKQFISDCIWPELDYLVIDLPPGTGDVQLTLVQSVPVTGAVLVTTPQEVAIADAIKAMNMFLLPNVNVPILGVVENMSWFTPAELPNNKYFIFGEGGGKKLAEKSESVLLGQVPLVQGIRESGDEGKPAILDNTTYTGMIFRKIAEETAGQIALRNESLAPTEIVKMKR
jgi:ATP-binding protein involved in chromosome partitioning